MHCSTPQTTMPRSRLCGVFTVQVTSLCKGLWSLSHDPRTITTCTVSRITRVSDLFCRAVHYGIVEPKPDELTNFPQARTKVWRTKFTNSHAGCTHVCAPTYTPDPHAPPPTHTRMRTNAHAQPCTHTHTFTHPHTHPHLYLLTAITGHVSLPLGKGRATQKGILER